MRTASKGYGIPPKLTANTLAFWPLDRGSGNLAYDIVNGRDLSDPTTNWGVGLVGRAVLLMGGGLPGLQDITTPAGTDAVALQGAWSAEVWVLPIAAGNTAILEYSDRTANLAPDNIQLGIELKADLKFRWRWQDGVAVDIVQDSTAALRAGVWQHIAVTKEADGGGTFTVSTYLNGVLDNTQTNIDPPAGGGQAYWQMGTGKIGNFTGSICSAHVTADVLTPAQVRENWRRGMVWSEPGGAGHGRTELLVYIKPTWSPFTYYHMNQFRYFWDFMESVEIEESVDSQVMTCTMGIKREIYDISFAPTMTGSLANRDPNPTTLAPGPASSSYAAFLGLEADIMILAVRLPSSIEDSGNGEVVFEGTIDEVSWGSDTIRVDCRGAGKALIDKYIETEREYNVSSDISIETTISTILADNGGLASIYTPTSPSFMLGAFAQRRESVMAASQALADQIGWVCKYRWDPITSAFRFTLYDPERERSRIDGVITENDYSEFGEITRNSGNVRNKVGLAYRNKLGQSSIVDDNGNYVHPPVMKVVSDAASIALYGTRYMEISESATVNIDEDAEATAMATAILNDLKDAETHMALDVPYWEIEVGDRLLFEENERTFDTAQTMAVLSKRIVFQEGRAQMQLGLKEAPASGFQKHLVKEAGPGRALPPTASVDESYRDFGSRGYYAPIVNLVQAANLLGESPRLSNLQNPGFLVHPQGIYGPPPGWEGVGPLGTWGSAGDIYFDATSQSGDRSLALQSVGAQAQSRWVPVIDGRVYETRVTWQGNHVADELTVEVSYYDATRTLTSTTQVINTVVTAINTWQVNAGIAATASGDRWAKITLEKSAGTRILVDRVEFDVLLEGFAAYMSGAQVVAGGTHTQKWDTERWDYGGVYNPANGTFTAQQPGLHQFHFYAYFTATVSSTLTQMILQMQVGGATLYSNEYAPGTGGTSADLWLHTPAVQLLSGDVVTCDLLVPVAGSIIASEGSGGRSPVHDR